MKILVIDNEPNIRKGVVRMIHHFYDDVIELHEAEGVVTGLNAIAEVRPNVVLLDVELDDGSGMDLLNKLKEISFHLIFITAHDKYAIEAFKFSAVDYLLKPIDPDGLVNALKKVKLQISNNLLAKQLEVMQESLSRITSQEKKIVLKDIHSIYFVNINNIIRCASDGQYTEFYLSDNQKIVISKSLKEYEELLKPVGFIRPHHSHLININKILRFDKVNGGSLIMENHEEVPVSHRKKSEILKILNQL